MKDYWVWCGSVIRGEDGRYHMFASRWPRGLSFGPHWLTNSEVVRAVSSRPEGPYEFQEVVLPPRGPEFWDGRMTHNPTIHKVGDTYLLFYTGTTYRGEMPTPEHPTTEDSPLKLEAHKNERIGLATSKSISGPWKRRDKPILDILPGTWEGFLVSNPAPVVMPDGKITLFYKGVERLRKNAIGIAVADHYEGPYRRLSDKPFDLGVDAEDPTIWYEDGRYYALMLDTGRKYSDKGIYYCTSEDLLHWEAAPNPVAISKTVLWEDNRYRLMDSTERPQILVQDGKATHVFLATGSKEDGQKSTWNMVIPLKPESEAADRMAWWREARFGMFIHWGLYSIPAGIWNGQPLVHRDYPNPYCEQIMWLNKIPISKYSQLAGQFNPEEFDARAVVQSARAAGMRYIVFTAKHHDGFAMYHSQCSPYNIVDATPYKRDPLRNLAAACRESGIRLCIYYSLGRDWHHPEDQAGKANTWDFPDPATRDYQKYLNEKVKPQLQELLTQYAPIGVVWFDTPEYTTLKQSIDLELFVNRLQPACIVNTRIGNGVGDYQEMSDNELPDQEVPVDWETPGTMAESWGYSVLDTAEFWKSPQELIRKLIETASKGGNYLLNIGLDGQGVVPARAVERLKAFTRWMKTNGESIYGSSASPLKKPYWGRYTRKGNRLYAHVFEWPENQALVLPIPQETVVKAELLTPNGPRPLGLKPTRGTAVILDLPAKAPEPFASVIRIERK